jgi:hypothetical protein
MTNIKNSISIKGDLNGDVNYFQRDIQPDAIPDEQIMKLRSVIIELLSDSSSYHQDPNYRQLLKTIQAEIEKPACSQQRLKRLLRNLYEVAQNIGENVIASMITAQFPWIVS